MHVQYKKLMLLIRFFVLFQKNNIFIYNATTGTELSIYNYLTFQFHSQTAQKQVVTCEAHRNIYSSELQNSDSEFQSFRQC